MASFDQSIDGVCIDEVVFFGPVTEKERKVREHFESGSKIDSKLSSESYKTAENDISRNDSLYRSFSVDDSKYDSYDDSLNEEIDKMPQETAQVPLRKSFDKLKSRKHSFYDSLEDVCSLASNIEKCSISCEAENNNNVKDKPCIIDDSLRNPSIAVANRNSCANDQINFDDDSLAIVEFENTFEDSLEEFNVLEIEEITDIEIVEMDNQNVELKVDQNQGHPTVNLFETSIPVIYEGKKIIVIGDQEESSDDKNVLYDSLSNSDFKDILKDSLEDSEKCFDNLLNQISNVSLINSEKSDEINALPNKVDDISGSESKAAKNKTDIKSNYEARNNSLQIFCEKRLENDLADQEESSDDKNALYDSLSNSDLKDILKDSLDESEKCLDGLLKHVSDTSLINPQISDPSFALPTSKVNVIETIVLQSEPDQKLNCEVKNLFDTSVQIIYEKGQEASIISQKESSDDKNVVNDSLSYSDFKDIPKDSIEKSEEHKLNLDHILDSQNKKTEVAFIKPDILNNSVQIVYENLQHFNSNVENIGVEPKENLEIFENDSRGNLKNIQDVYEAVLKYDNIRITQSSNENQNKDVKPDANQNCKKTTDELNTVLSKSDVENPNFNKEVFTVDSCHLKLLNDNLKANDDLKFQLHIEVTVGDKKCKIASEDIKILPVTNSNSEIKEIVSPPLVVSTETENVSQKESVGAASSSPFVYNESKELGKEKNNSLIFSDEDIINEKLRMNDTNNITSRIRAKVSSQLNDSDLNFNFHENANDMSLFQALDLHDMSIPFVNDSITQSSDSVIPLNLCSDEQDIKKIQMSLFSNECKENASDLAHSLKDKKFSSPVKKANNSKTNLKKTPKSSQKSPSLKENAKKASGTKIPVRKVENFAVPTITPMKLTKQVPCTSAEKVKKQSHVCHSEKKTPNKTPHFCKVRNTIFSKVPQIVPSKKYINVESPVAQYIRNTPVKSPVLDPVLRDCMNHMRVHQQLESPYHLFQSKDGSAKSAKRKA